METVESLDVTIADVAARSKVMVDGKMLPCSMIELRMGGPNGLVELVVAIPLVCIAHRHIEYVQGETGLKK